MTAVGWHFAPEAPPSLENFGFQDVGGALALELLRALASSPTWRRQRVAYVVRADGVEVMGRDALAQHYRRHGLRELVAQVRRCPLDRICLALEGEPETRILALDPSRVIPPARDAQ